MHPQSRKVQVAPVQMVGNDTYSHDHCWKYITYAIRLLRIAGTYIPIKDESVKRKRILQVFCMIFVWLVWDCPCADFFHRWCDWFSSILCQKCTIKVWKYSFKVLIWSHTINLLCVIRLIPYTTSISFILFEMVFLWVLRFYNG